MQNCRSQIRGWAKCSAGVNQCSCNEFDGAAPIISVESWTVGFKTSFESICYCHPHGSCCKDDSLFIVHSSTGTMVICSVVCIHTGRKRESQWPSCYYPTSFQPLSLLCIRPVSEQMLMEGAWSPVLLHTPTCHTSCRWPLPVSATQGMNRTHFLIDDQGNCALADHPCLSQRQQVDLSLISATGNACGMTCLLLLQKTAARYGRYPNALSQRMVVGTLMVEGAVKRWDQYCFF